MNGIKITGGGFDKVVFESEIDTLAGGVTLDVSGVTFADGVVPAGTLVSVKDSNGFSYPVKITNPGDSATFDRVPLGFVHMTVPVDDNTLVGVVIEGVVRKDAVAADVKTSAKAIAAVIPKITFV
ncbi:hypothetical protein AAHN97_15010 [Chitinophaga niabensis]|uniref:hypothetical protein n=1 Tax=Chitinophaga niabensis TaxID=536979 RepID=UPI0031BB29B7